MGKVLVAVATYNEIESLPGLVEEIFRYLPEADLLVIDDNSPDGTGDWCDQQAAKDPRLHCLHRPGKLGLGTATIDGLNYALEHGYHRVVNMDGDFSHHPQHLPDLCAGVAENADSPADVMIGSRYVPGGAIEGWPWYRRWMSRGVNCYARTLLRLPVSDCSGSYRCYRTEILSKIDWSSVRSRGYSIYEEILWHLRQADARFREIPITFVDRQKGRSKINWREAVAALWIIFRTGLRRSARSQ
jgi:dolichol-phosphate mannosyltransferase